MLSRREIIRDGLLLSTAGALAPVVATARPMPPEIWIVDRQMPAAPDALSQAVSGGSEVLTFTADPGLVWMNRLEPRLKGEPFAIGGYTSASVLFCLHYLARDYGLALGGVAKGPELPDAVMNTSDAPIDLRDPGFADQNGAFSWLMVPRRT